MTKQELQLEINNITQAAEEEIRVLRRTVKNFKKSVGDNPKPQDFNDMEAFYHHLVSVNENHFITL